MNTITAQLLAGLTVLAAGCSSDEHLRTEPLSLGARTVPHTWKFPASLMPADGIPEPPVTVLTAGFDRRGFSDTQEREIATELARAELARFVYAIGEFSRGAFFVGELNGKVVAFAQEARPVPMPEYRTWMVVHDSRHFQATTVTNGAGWHVNEVLPKERTIRSLHECAGCLPDAHRTGEAVGPPFLIDRTWVQWRETYFAGVPFATFVALYRTLHGLRTHDSRATAPTDPGYIDDDFEIVTEVGGAQLLRATFATRVTTVLVPSSPLQTFIRPICSVDVQHRARWLVGLSGRSPRIEIDQVVPGVVRCCARQTFTRPRPVPLCVESPITT